MRTVEQRLSTSCDRRLRYLVSSKAAVRQISTTCWSKGGHQLYFSMLVRETP